MYRFGVRSVEHVLIGILTPWSRVLLEKLTGFQLVKKFPAFYGNRRFITAVTSTLFRNMIRLLTSRPNSKLEDNPLSAVHGYLFIMSEATCFGPHKAETCSLPHNTYDVFDVKGFKFILTIRLITHRDVYNQMNI